MPKLKIDKHIVYSLIMNNLEWFEFPLKKDGKYRFLTRSEIENRINQYLKKDYPINRWDQNYDPPFISLNASTLTAMVNDYVLERKYSDTVKCYTYRPCSELNEEYGMELKI